MPLIPHAGSVASSTEHDLEGLDELGGDRRRRAPREGLVACPDLTTPTMSAVPDPAV